jgi:zinc-ribbon domain
MATPETHFCPHCGSSVGGSDLFCRRCGTRIGEAEANSAASPDESASTRRGLHWRKVLPSLFVLTALVLAIAAVAGFTVLSSASAGTGPGEVRITSREVSRMRVDAGRPGRGVGDTQIVRYNLFNKRFMRRPLGHADYVCTFVTTGTRHCIATFFLPKGRLVAGGSIRYSALHELAILGGTRLYDNARGTLTVLRTTRRPRRNILLFRLAG